MGSEDGGWGSGEERGGKVGWAVVRLGASGKEGGEEGWSGKLGWTCGKV